MDSAMKLKGKFKARHIRDGKCIAEFEFSNAIVDEGLNHILETEFKSGAAVPTWYLGLINNTPTPTLANANTMGSHSPWVEATVYDETDRPAWTPGDAASRTITNAATVDFTINDTVTIYGIFVTSSLAKSGTSGILWATGAFASPRAFSATDVLQITYTVNG